MTIVYDGDGRRVKSTFNGTTTTYFVGTHYEVTNGVVTKYYYAGAQRIAMRTNGTLNYLLGDHLGSTSLVTDSTGVKINEQRYKAWGETRYTFGNEKTKYQYTGQYSHTSDFGLMFYNARWYDPSLGRFAQADSIVPAGVQGYDRYAYTSNNPVRYIDPSGHCSGSADDPDNSDLQCWVALQQITDRYSFISVNSKNWTAQELSLVYQALQAMENSFGGVDEFGNAIGNATLYRASGNSPLDLALGEGANPALRIGHTITFFDSTFVATNDAIYTTIHEFGHIFDGNGKGTKSDVFEDTFWENCLGIGGRCFAGIGSPNGTIASQHAGSNPGEDFAETFATTVWKENFDVLVVDPNAIMSVAPPPGVYLPNYINLPNQERMDYMTSLVH